VIDVPNHRLYVLFSTFSNPPQQKIYADCPDSSQIDHRNCGSNPCTCADPCTCATSTFEDSDLRNLHVAYWLVALDYRDGTEIARAWVDASRFRTDGTPVNFVAKNQFDRPGLLLQQGSIYIAFGTRPREDIIEYHGWVMRYRASDLAFQGAFCTS